MKQLYAATLFNLLACTILIGSFAGCSVLDPAEDIPSYIHIDKITLNALANQGTSRATITEAWIFMDGKLLGGFELPCTVPILADGTHSFTIRGGVRMNGLSSTRAIYPSWKAWESSVTLMRGQKTIVAPVVTYFPDWDFSNTTWLLDFDGSGTSFISDPTSQAIIIRDSIPWAYEGPYSAKIHLNNTDTTVFIGVSASQYYMPTTKDTWLEFDYKSDCEFTVGIEDPATPPNNRYRVPWLLVQPNGNWKKIYVRLTDALAEASQLNANPSFTPYKIYFAMVNPSTQAESTLYIDNIKLLK
ncbi:hypothetical protein BH11BAC7_BH11BAC7_12880 [soil metagenome]